METNLSRKRRTRDDKRSAMMRHAKLRARERWGFPDFPCGRVARTIRSAKTEGCHPVERQSNNRTIWIVRVDGVEVPVVYNARQGAIATVLPPEWFERMSSGEDDKNDVHVPPSRT